MAGKDTRVLMGYECRVLADTVNNGGDRLITVALSYPWMVHNEWMTVRKFSRNTSSSRAVPVDRVIQQCVEDPVIPLSFGKNTRGMVAKEELPEAEQLAARSRWLLARDSAVGHARLLAEMGVHKQFANRILAPFMWVTGIYSATDVENFFALRLQPDVQPEMRKIAEMFADAYYTHVPTLRYGGDWHLPLITAEERTQYPLSLGNLALPRLSAARCASVSYLRQDDVRSYDEWMRVYNILETGGHMSPLEHPAWIVDKEFGMRESWRTDFGNFAEGFLQLRKMIAGESRKFTRADWEAYNDRNHRSSTFTA
jgi:hypothetical protein